MSNLEKRLKDEFICRKEDIKLTVTRDESVVKYIDGIINEWVDV